MEDHALAPVLVREGNADAHPAILLVDAGTLHDGVDFAVGFGHTDVL